MPMYDIEALLKNNAYPGRGIILGRSADSEHAVIAYFIMGRSVNSRNRVFAATEDGIRTQAHDPALMQDPSLIIYHPVRVFGGQTIVTNGDQTDTVRDFLAAGKTFEAALRTRTFEPDAPNFTPRVSGLLCGDGRYALSILKSEDGDLACCCRYFYEYDNPLAGTGHFIHTYRCDGDPIPSFEGEPERVGISAPDAPSFARLIWDSLNEKNKVSLFVRYINLGSRHVDTVILNINEQE